MLGLRPATINRLLLSLKRYCGWGVDAGLVARDPSHVVKLIPGTEQPPGHLTDREEEALMAAVSQHRNLRDRTLLVVALHTGVRAEELCSLKPDQVHLGGYLIAPLLDQDVQHDSVLVNGSPQPVAFATDLQRDFVQMPLVTGLPSSSTQPRTKM